MTEEFDVPAFEFSPEDIANIRANLGLPENEVPVTPDVSFEQPAPRRRRGRPPKKSVVIEEPSFDTTPSSSLPEVIPPAPLTKREEREVASRLANILTGGTGLVAIPTKPYIAMTDEEAQAIAEPLASYLVRNADTVPVARQILENYDLLAVGMGTASYLVRVANDRRDERESEQSIRKSSTLDRVYQDQERDNGREQSEGVSNPIGTPSFAGSPRIVPADI